MMHCTFENQICVCCERRGPKLGGTARVLRVCKSPCDKLTDQTKRPTQAIPTSGPGTELKALLQSLGITEKPNCGCKALMNTMNQLGVKGCREKRDTLVKMLREKREAFGLKDTAKAAALAFATGLAFQISWFDPMPDLFDLAVSRAEGKLSQTQER